MPVVVLSAVFCCVLWGSASPAIKIAYELFRIDASDTASRLVLAGAMLCAALFYEFSGCFIKIFSKHDNPVVLSGDQFFCQLFSWEREMKRSRLEACSHCYLYRWEYSWSTINLRRNHDNI